MEIDSVRFVRNESLGTFNNLLLLVKASLDQQADD